MNWNLHSGHLCCWAPFRLDRLQPPRLDAYLLRKKGRGAPSTIEQTSQMRGKGEMAISLLNSAGWTAEQGTIISRPRFWLSRPRTPRSTAHSDADHDPRQPSGTPA